MPAGIGTDVCNCRSWSRAVLLDAVVIGGVWYGNVRGSVCRVGVLAPWLMKTVDVLGSLGVEGKCTVFGAVDVRMGE